MHALEQLAALDEELRNLNSQDGRTMQALDNLEEANKYLTEVGLNLQQATLTSKNGNNEAGLAQSLYYNRLLAQGELHERASEAADGGDYIRAARLAVMAGDVEDAKRWSALARTGLGDIIGDKP